MPKTIKRKIRTLKKRATVPESAIQSAIRSLEIEWHPLEGLLRDPAILRSKAARRSNSRGPLMKSSGRKAARSKARAGKSRKFAKRWTVSPFQGKPARYSRFGRVK